MPAKNVIRVAKEGTYSHIYNRGVEKRVIFNEAEDYEAFLGFLNNYLTPGDLKSAKKEFSVNGHIFKGVPHQPKNYFNKVELIAYSLMPNHFHLLLHQITTGSVEKFMRSLSTRYSMYFNKKYKRNGALFGGPYKSVHINNSPALLFLSKYLHNSPRQSSKELTSGYSSYQEYLGLRKTPWVKPEFVLSLIDKGEGGYKDFVEKYEFTEKENEALEGIILERMSEHLEGRIHTLAKSQTIGVSESKENVIPNPNESQNPNQAQNRNLQVKPIFVELMATIVIFIILVGLGIKNIRAYSTNTANIPNNKTTETSAPTVSGTKDEKSSEQVVVAEKTKPSAKVVIKITDGSSSVNIRRNPSVQSEKIGEAKDGQTFEFVSINSGWYEVKLDEGSNGFILAVYAEMTEGAN